jgi:2-keto-4-pentenoate hydratase/2-oxohepta-3-ene-1,7-dioic acid hydratase in catechol pathway
MRWVRYSYGEQINYGLLEEKAITPVSGTPFEHYVKSETRLNLSEVRLLPPVVPPTFFAVAQNYIAHTAEAATILKKAINVPEKPDVGYRAVSALIGDGEDIVIPKESSGVIQFEGELVAVIGKKAKRVSEEDALDYVLGFTIGNDISERSWQAIDKTLWRAKNSDTFKPMGPWIETDVFLPDLVTEIRLNGASVSRFDTNKMIFGVARYIAEITRFVTMYPGDVLWMGAEAPSLDMRPGDVVEIEISGIGVLRNPVVAEDL